MVLMVGVSPHESCLAPKRGVEVCLLDHGKLEQKRLPWACGRQPVPSVAGIYILPAARAGEGRGPVPKVVLNDCSVVGVEDIDIGCS